MCTVCGCHTPDHHGDPHGHGHHHHHADLDGAQVAGLDQPRIIQIEQDILAHNNDHAARNRAAFVDRGILALNLVSSPGSGKTTLLCRTIDALNGRVPVAVIEGDQQTDFDAERIRATGAPALQINTGKGCHLDAHMIQGALSRLHPQDDSVLFVENVGNLVCPAAFDLGEAAKVAILSVTEGEDKPLKYPDMFQAASVLLLNKIDLLPHVDFDIKACLDHAHRVNPALTILTLSARTGEGLDAWLEWIAARRRDVLSARASALEGKLAAVRASLGAG